MTEEQFEKIEAYLDGQIDYSALSEGMGPDETEGLGKEVEGVRRAREAVFAAGIREEIADLHRNSGATPKIRRLPPWYGIAAAAVVVLMAGLWWLGSASGQPYAEYTYQDPGLPVLMGVADDPAFAEAMTRFKQGDFTGSASAFQDLDTGVNNDTLTYYYGASEYYAENYSLASVPLSTVAEDETSLFRDKAEWLLILTYLKDGQETEAKARLENVTGNEANQFHQSARDLMEDLSQ